MDTVKIENSNTEMVEVIDSEFENESPPLSEDSESNYEHLKQTGVQICTDNYSGRFKFDFFLALSDGSKRHWMYSATLNKVFIDMNRILPIQFQWDFDEADLLGVRDLRIRAILIFANSEFQQLSIKRCPLHIMQDNLRDHKKEEHIIWCEQNDVIYEEDPNSRRLSVVANVQNCLSHSQQKTFNVLYKFMCKSSCSLSLNRRPVYIVFTLETQQGTVLGRKKIGLKVCSCPRRDMLKEEELEKRRLSGISNSKKRTIQFSNDIPKKVSKTTNIDKNTLYELPVLAVPSKKLYLSTLELLHGHFLGSAVREDLLIHCHPLISMLSELINQVKTENNDPTNDTDSENQLNLTNGDLLL